MTPKPRDPHSDPSDNNDEKATCYVCETDLTPSNRKKGKKDKCSKDDKEAERGVVDLRSEGTGFAGGGTNMAKREGVAFQC